MNEHKRNKNLANSAATNDCHTNWRSRRITQPSRPIHQNAPSIPKAKTHFNPRTKTGREKFISTVGTFQNDANQKPRIYAVG